MKDAEDNNDENENNDDIDNEDTGQEENEYSPVEQEAMEAGWNPDFEGEDKRSAREFLDRGSFFKKIEEQNKSLKAQDKSLKEAQNQINFLIDRNKQSDDLMYKRAIAELKDKKLEAMEANDNVAVVELDDEIADTKQAHKESKNVVVEDTTDDNNTPAASSEFGAWAANNEWYSTNEEMHDAADEIGSIFYRKNPGASENQVFAHVTKRIKTLYRKNFVNENRDKAGQVEGDASTNRKQKSKSKVGKYSVKDLSYDERQIMQNMINASVIKDEQEYINKLEQTGYFK